MTKTRPIKTMPKLLQQMATEIAKADKGGENSTRGQVLQLLTLMCDQLYRAGFGATAVIMSQAYEFGEYRASKPRGRK